MLIPAVVASLALPGQALATDKRTITSMGCSMHEATCWVVISGAAVGPPSCRINALRFSLNSVNGQNILSLVTDAYLAGRKVEFDVDYTTCFGPQPSFPTFRSITL